jgi:hypothetical protein
MQIIVTVFLDDLYSLLANVPRLVTLYEKKEISFIAEFMEWLSESERLLEKNHRPQIGEVAAIRARLLAASDGVYDRSALQFPANGSRRKLMQANAVLLLNQAQVILSGIYQSYFNRREQAEKFVNQIVLISLQKGTFYPVWESSESLSEKLNRLWQSFAADPDLVQGTRQILTQVGYPDALRIMDETITALNL